MPMAELWKVVLMMMSELLYVVTAMTNSVQIEIEMKIMN